MKSSCRYLFVLPVAFSLGSANRLHAGVGTTTPFINYEAEALGFARGAGQIQLSWPQDHLGWTLQAQTNSNAAGHGTNWVTPPSSTATNQIAFPIDPANRSVFFRLVLP